jgi:hypothetical protein
MDYLAVCAIYRNEAEFLGEWLEFHRLAGVQRFFLETASMSTAATRDGSRSSI